MGKQRAHRAQRDASHTDSARLMAALMVAVTEIEDTFPQEMDTDRGRRGQQIHSKMRLAARDLNALERSVGEAFPAEIADCRARLHNLADRTLTYMFDPPMESR